MSDYGHTDPEELAGISMQKKAYNAARVMMADYVDGYLQEELDGDNIMDTVKPINGFIDETVSIAKDIGYHVEKGRYKNDTPEEQWEEHLEEYGPQRHMQEAKQSLGQLEAHLQSYENAFLDHEYDALAGHLVDVFSQGIESTEVLMADSMETQNTGKTSAD